jgi:arabinogalactan oligomer/maltooligosaccharide transport system substrate-binding protein
VCDFDNDTGIEVGKAIEKIAQNPAFISGDNSVLTGGMGTTICAGISGTWNADAIMKKLGENYAATKLPTFTLNGQQVQMGSFAGYKIVGVNSATAHPIEAMKLAQWLTNEENQIKRFEMREIGPSNINASKNEKISQNVALSALSLQNQFASSQKDVLGGFWDPMKAFGTSVLNGDTKSIAERLKAMVSQIEG